MKVGTLCYATEQGLGILAKDFYDNGVVTDPFVVRHSCRPTRDDWYPNAPSSGINRVRCNSEIEKFCASMDVVLFFETPFDWGLVDYCRSVGVKTVIMPMHECMPERVPAQPDLWLCPSLLDLEWAGKHSQAPAAFVPIPVDPSTWRLRTRVETFLHSAGWGGLRSRNGTGELLDAWKLVKSPTKLILRSQGPLQWSVDDPRIDVRIGTVPRSEIFSEGDAFVFPEKFNGLSLPLQEARAAGMLVLAADRFPINTWLPREALFSVGGYRKARIGGPYSEFDEAVIEPKEIAEIVDWWYKRSIELYSRRGYEWALKNSWEALKPVYLRTLEALL